MFKGKRIKIDDVGYVKKGLRVVYTGDTKKCANLETISKGADLLIHDATFLDEKANRMHSGVGGAAELARKAGVKKLFLTHFSRRYQDTKPLLDEARKTFPETLIAEDFMGLELKNKPSFSLRVVQRR